MKNILNALMEKKHILHNFFLSIIYADRPAKNGLTTILMCILYIGKELRSIHLKFDDDFTRVW